MTMTEAVKQLLLDWDPTAFDEEGSGVIRSWVASSGRVIYRYIPFSIKPGMRIGPPLLVSANPDDLEDIRFAAENEFYEYMDREPGDEGVLE